SFHTVWIPYRTWSGSGCIAERRAMDEAMRRFQVSNLTWKMAFLSSSPRAQPHWHATSRTKLERYPEFCSRIGFAIITAR
ncbi:MAG: hypothetical protein Q4P24_18215, partial [Rhodobacterales bacterium]|nr:hypothetical protein [Rhodobacterales bacterium]